MMTSRRCSTVFILLVVYSSVYCDTSNIFDLFKRTSSSHPGSAKGARSDEVGIIDLDDYEQNPPYESQHTNGGGGGGAGERNGGHYGHTARGHHGSYGGGHGHGDSNLDLYSLLGGLSFASLLGATIVFLARRSSTTTVMMNASGRRRRRDLDDADEELVGESLPEFLSKLGVHLENPWWKSKSTKGDKVVPFKLI